MTRKPQRSKPIRSHVRRGLDLLGRDEEPHPRLVTDVTPEPAPPLDDTPVPPLTDPNETKGG